MKVVFIQKDSFVKIAIEQLYAVLKKSGHDCELFIESGEKDFIKSALGSGADLFAFSCTTGGEFWVLDIIKKLKKQSSVSVIVGGPHTTFFPEMVENPDIDYICQGEGEYALLDLLEAIENNPNSIKKIPNIWSKGSFGEIYKNEVRQFACLDDLPAPDFEIYTKYKYLVPYNREMYAVITGRGCPYNCSYCFNKTYKDLYSGKGTYLRKRSPEKLIHDLLYAKKKYDIRQINFIDDSFFSFPSWLREFAEIYKKKLNLPFFINSEATQVKEEYVRLVKEMGCICVRMGVETGNEHLRRNVLNKKISNKQISDAAKLFKQFRIKLTTYNIFGLPGETLENSLETYKLNKDIGSDFAWCSLLQPYPGTEISRIAKEEGFLEDENIAVNESFFVSSKMNIQNKKEVGNLQKLMQFFLQFHVPLAAVRLIIRLPDNPAFHLIFKLSFVYNKIKVQKLSFIPIILLGTRSLSYMGTGKKAKG